MHKIELLLWDLVPGCMTHHLEDPLPAGAELGWHDDIAALTLVGDNAFSELHAAFEEDDRFQSPPEILS